MIIMPKYDVTWVFLIKVNTILNYLLVIYWCATFCFILMKAYNALILKNKIYLLNIIYKSVSSVLWLSERTSVSLGEIVRKRCRIIIYLLENINNKNNNSDNSNKKNWLIKYLYPCTMTLQKYII